MESTLSKMSQGRINPELRMTLHMVRRDILMNKLGEYLLSHRIGRGVSRKVSDADILKDANEGLTSQQSAEKRNVSERTICDHRHKLNLSPPRQKYSTSQVKEDYAAGLSTGEAAQKRRISKDLIHKKRRRLGLKPIPYKPRQVSA